MEWRSFKADLCFHFHCSGNGYYVVFFHPFPPLSLFAGANAAHPDQQSLDHERIINHSSKTALPCWSNRRLLRMDLCQQHTISAKFEHWKVELSSTLLSQAQAKYFPPASDLVEAHGILYWSKDIPAICLRGDYCSAVLALLPVRKIHFPIDWLFLHWRQDCFWYIFAVLGI